MRMNRLSLGQRSNHCTIVVRVQMQQMNENNHDYELFVMFTVEAATLTGKSSENRNLTSTLTTDFAKSK